MTGKDGIPGRCHTDSLLTIGHKVKAIRAGHPGVLQQEIWRWSEQLAPAIVARQYAETEQRAGVTATSHQAARRRAARSCRAAPPCLCTSLHPDR